MNTKRIFVLISLVGLMQACDQASETEKQARRENAFDLAGKYAATQALNSELEMQIEISNKSDRSDVVVKATRNYPLSIKETGLFAKFGVSENQVRTVVGPTLVFEAGAEARDAGGSNVSDDFGKTSRIRVDTISYALGGNITAVYSLVGTVKKEDLSFSGDLELRVTRNVEGSGYDSQSVILKIAARTDAVSWTQVFGSWSGRVETDLGSDFAPLRGLGDLRITRNQDETYSITPDLSAVLFKNDTYKYVSENRPLDELRQHSAPFVQMVWQGPAGRRLVMVASIWSLGQFTGNILWEVDQKETLVGGFQLKRR
jgi:hypothetical protein